MQVKYKTVLWENGNVNSRQMVELLPCCEQMSIAVGLADPFDCFVGFGEFQEDYGRHPASLNISHCKPWPEGAGWDYMAIQFCPFCAEAITLQEVQVVRLVPHEVPTTRTEYNEVPIEPKGK